MKSIEINFSSIFSVIIFTFIFGIISYFITGAIDNFVFRIIISLVLFIIYLNIVKLFVFEILSLEKTRASEVLNYVLMYLVTISLFVLPAIITPNYVFESVWLRRVIIIFASILLSKYFFYMVLGPIHSIIHRLNHYVFYEKKKYEPLVSIIIPAWNEEVGILNTIKSILSSTYRKIEIVVVNDGSTDNSDKIISNFINSYNKSKTKDIKIKYKYQENGGKGSALNHAIDLSEGEIIVSIDADCFVDKDAIYYFVEEFKNPKVMASVGNVKIGNRNSTIGMVQYLEFLFSFYFKKSESLLGSIYIIGGAAGAFRREVFDKVGKYSTNNITEDIELTVRIQDAGMKITYSPKSVVYTEGASDIEGLKKQRLRWKLGRFQTFYRHYKLFFSTKKRHNKFLTFFTMPLAIISEIQLLLELPFVIFLYIFSIINSDFSSFMSGVVVVGTIFVVQFLFDDKNTRKFSFVALAPIGWMIFYMATYVESYALVKSISSFVSGKDVKWQSWKRSGVGSGYLLENK